MTKTKWHSKLLSLSIAFALVFSLVAMVVPVAAQTNTLSIDVSADNSTYCCSQNVTVTANITNSVGAGNATNIQTTISWDPTDQLVVVTPADPADGYNITAGGSQIVTWVLHCEGPGTPEITVTAEADNADLVSDSVTITQKGAKLQATIIQPEEGVTYHVCDNFTLEFMIENTGCSDAENVNGTVFPSSKVNVVGLVGGQSWTVATVPLLGPGENVTYIVDMHCYGADETGFLSSIHVLPAGEDSCTERQIEAGYIFSDIVHFHQVFGVDCEVDTDPSKVCHNVTFTATVGQGAIYPVSWNWTFDDGGSAGGVLNNAGENPITIEHHYQEPGNFTACVNVTDEAGISATCCSNITVYPPLSVACGVTYNQTKVCHNVTFTGDIIGGIPEPPAAYNWTWEFGDGESSSGSGIIIEAEHHYAINGTFNATLTVWDNYDPLFNDATCNVTVEVFPPLGISCNATPLETKAGHAVNFTAERIGGLPADNPEVTYEWFWDFGDGDTAGWQASPDAQHTYDSGGNKTATVTLRDGHKEYNNTATCNVTILVHPSLNVTCNVTPDPQNVCHAVNFTAERDGGVPGNSYNWTWSFSDGTTAVGQNVTKMFMCVGTYTGTVILTDEVLGNTANCTATVEIIIEPPELYTPGNGVTVQSSIVCFEWEDIGCCNYTLEIWQKDGSESKVWLVDTGKDNFWCGPIMDGNYKWQVTATDACGISAVSDLWYFGVAADEIYPDVTVFNPNGGEVLAAGSQETITWEATEFQSPQGGFGVAQGDLIIDIWFSSNGGSVWTNVAMGEDNDGAYLWAVPWINSGQCLIRVDATDDVDNVGIDTSDAVFTITTGATVSIGSAAVTVNGTANVTITITGVTDMAGVDIWLSYDKDVVVVSGVAAGDLGALSTVSIDNANGVTKINRFTAIGQTGDFTFANIELEAVGSAGESSSLDLEVKDMIDSNGVVIPRAVSGGVFDIVQLMEGDVTMDFHVTIADAMFIAQWEAALRTLNTDQLECADTFDGGTVSIMDAMHIAQWLVDPDQLLGVLIVDLWVSPADDHMLQPLP